MEGYWLISYIALWVVTITLGIVILAHSRLIGLLHHRLSPSGARPLADGPAPGTRFEKLRGVTLEGGPWELAFPVSNDTLLLFFSPMCQLCDELAPHALDFSAAHRNVKLIVLSTLDDPGMNQAFVRYRRLSRLDYYIAPALAEEMSVSGTPYAVLLDPTGVVKSKGLVNHYEHLRSLLEPARNGAPGPTAADSDEESNSAHSNDVESNDVELSDVKSRMEESRETLSAKN